MTPARPDLERLQAVELGPNDVIIANVRPGTAIDGDDQKWVIDFLTSEFPGHQVVLLDGIDLEVHRPHSKEQ